MNDAASADSSSAPSRTGLWIAATAIVFLVLQAVPLPGIDGEALLSIAGGGGLSVVFNSVAPLPMLGAGVLMIVPLHLVLMLLGKLDATPLRVAAVAVCLLVVALEALAVALWLESLNAMYIDVVSFPGWGFRLTVLASRLASAAVVLFFVGRIDRSRGAWGALVLTVIYALAGAVTAAFGAGQAVANGQVEPLLGLANFVTPLCVSAVALALLIRALGWPVTLFGSVSLRSGWDVAGMVTLASLPVFMAGHAMLTLSGAESQSLPLLGALGQLLFTAVVLFLVFRRPRTEPGVRPWGLMVICALSTAGASVLFVAGAASSPVGLSGLFAPGPLEGDAQFVLVLGAEERFSDDDGLAMVERLQSLGADATLDAQSAEQVTLSVTARDPQAVVAALTPHTLALRFAHDFAVDPFGADARLEPIRSYPSDGGVHGWRGECEVIREVASGPAPSSCVLRVEPSAEDCALYCVDPEPFITGADIAEADVLLDEFTQHPTVALTLSPEAATRFERGTGAHVNSVLAIEYDGEILCAPVVQMAIPGGRVHITLGGANGYEAMMEEASSLAASLGGGGVSWGGFELLEVR